MWFCGFLYELTFQQDKMQHLLTCLSLVIAIGGICSSSQDSPDYDELERVFGNSEGPGSGEERPGSGEERPGSGEERPGSGEEVPAQCLNAGEYVQFCFGSTKQLD
jgi:hypothetical protein